MAAQFSQAPARLAPALDSICPHAIAERQGQVKRRRAALLRCSPELEQSRLRLGMSLSARSLINRPRQGFAQARHSWYLWLMSEGRIVTAIARIEAAMERIAEARANAPSPTQASAEESGSSAKVMALVNAHEKLREDVADTMRELDDLIEDLEA